MAEPVSLALEILLGDLYGRAVNRLVGGWQKRVARYVAAAVGLPYAESGLLRLFGSEAFWRQLAAWSADVIPDATVDEHDGFAARIRQAIDPYKTLGSESANEKVQAALAALWAGMWQEMPHELRPSVASLQATLGLAGEIGSLRNAVARLESAQAEDIGWLVVWLEDLRLDERLPVPSAGQAEVQAYLKHLVRWLNEDRWPGHRFGGPVLTPSAIERKLYVETGTKRERVVAADEVAEQARRLVIVGGPGSGKTWLAKRTARRCAERALADLEHGVRLSEIELPVYLTCRDLVEQAGDINQAIVAAAIDHIGDLGSKQRVDSICRLLSNREASMLVVVDSLDEAAGSPNQHRRLRQLDSMVCRLVLTTRPSGWSQQIALNEGNDPTHVLGLLRPLAYPGDVHPFIEQWFKANPEIASSLIAQIDKRRDLQRSSTVPLILAFYCILANDGTVPLPRFSKDLYDQLINRLLSGTWRETQDPGRADHLDVKALGAALNRWAWQAADRNDPTSELGDWQDDFGVPYGAASPTAREAIDHLAPSYGARDLDTGTVRRRFLHRTLHEHLVARHLADPTLFPLNIAARALMPHLWYDPDWEITAPTAVARRSDRNRLLRLLLATAAGSPEVPTDLTIVDGGGELHRFLVRLATETDETDWTPDTTALIGEARVHLARTDQLGLVATTTHWTATNPPIRAHLLDEINRRGSRRDLLDTFIQLDPTADESAAVRSLLLKELATATSGTSAQALVQDLLRFHPTPEEKATTRAATLDRLEFSHGDATSLVDALLQLDPTPHDRATAQARVIARLGAGVTEVIARDLVDALLRLGITPEGKTLTRSILLRMMQAPPSDSSNTVRGRFFLHRASASWNTAWRVGRLLTELKRLDPTSQDRATTRSILLDLLPTAPEQLVVHLIDLEPTPEDQATAHRKLRHSLTRTTSRTVTQELIDQIIQLDPTDVDKAITQAAIIDKLATCNSAAIARELVEGLTRLATGPGDGPTIRTALLGKLAVTTDVAIAAWLVDSLLRLDPTPTDLAAARAVLFNGLAATHSPVVARQLTDVLRRVVTDPAEQAAVQSRARYAIVALLSRRRGGSTSDLVENLLQLNPTPEDLAAARTVLLEKLATETDEYAVSLLVDDLLRLDPTPQDGATARLRVLDLLDTASDSTLGRSFVAHIVRLDPTIKQKAEVRTALLDRLAAETPDRQPSSLVHGILQLDPAPEDTAAARAAVLRALRATTNCWVARDLLDDVARLGYTAEDRVAARAAAIKLLSVTTKTRAARHLLDGLAELDPRPEDAAAAWRGAIKLLAVPGGGVGGLVGGLVQLADTPLRQAAAQAAVIELLSTATNSWVIEALMSGLVQLAVDPDDGAAARAVVIRLLTTCTAARQALQLVSGLLQLGPTSDDKARSRGAITGLLTKADGWASTELAGCLLRLDPTPQDLGASSTWSTTLPPQLLRAARGNAPLEQWLEALPNLSWISQREATARRRPTP